MKEGRKKREKGNVRKQRKGRGRGRMGWRMFAMKVFMVSIFCEKGRVEFFS